MKINGKEIKIKEFTFNTLIDLEDHGVTLDTLSNSPLKFVRATLAINENISVDEAGLLIQELIVSGGNLEDLVNEITKSLTESGFMKALQSQVEVAEE